MLEIKVTVSCPDLVEAAKMFATALKSQPVPPAAAVPAPSVTAAPGPAVASPPIVTPTPAPAIQPTVPLAAAPTFTLEQLAQAGADLVTREPAKIPATQALLQQFGIDAVTKLPKEQYGAFATALRGLGASI